MKFEPHKSKFVAKKYGNGHEQPYFKLFEQIKQILKFIFKFKNLN